MPTTGDAAVGLFILSLIFNLVSYGSSQLDMVSRVARLDAGRTDGLYGVGWQRATTILNILAGVAFVLGSIFLALFVNSAT